MNLATSPTGQVIKSWIQRIDGGAELRYAVLENGAWSTTGLVASGDDWFINWADFPSVVPIDDATWAAHWLVRSADISYAYDVAIAVSTDGGSRWSNPIVPHTDGTPTEHGFVSLFPWQGGVGAVWLDGRKTINEYDADNPAASGMTLRAAVIQPDGTVASEALIDDLICDCCQTDVTLTPSGPLAAYRNRTTSEIRDIYVSGAQDGKWQPGFAANEDGWEIAGCPVNGPAVASDGSRVVLAWFTGADDIARVRVAFSADEGGSFAPAVDVVTGNTLGRVDALLATDGSAIIATLHGIGNGAAEVRLQRVGMDGTVHPPLVVAETSASRLSGFPRLAQTADGIVVAWTNVEGEATAVMAALVDPNRI